MKTIFKKLKNKHGFSLAEVMFSVMLISIMTAAAVTLISSSTKTYKESLFVSDSTLLADTINSGIADILRYAKYDAEKDNESIISPSNVYFTFEEFKKSYFDIQNGELFINIKNSKSYESKALLTSSTYSDIDITSFNIEYTNGVYYVTYILTFENLTRDFSTTVGTVL